MSLDTPALTRVRNALTHALLEVERAGGTFPTASPELHNLHRTLVAARSAAYLLSPEDPPEGQCPDCGSPGEHDPECPQL